MMITDKSRFRSCKGLLLFLFFMGFPQFLGARGWYVSAVRGEDRAAGTREAPLRTIGHAATLLRPGDTCYILEGVYREEVVPPVDGKAGLPVVFTGMGEAVITGTVRVTSWLPWRGRIVKAWVPRRVTQLWVGSRRASWAREPDEGNDPFSTATMAEVTATPDRTVSFAGRHWPRDHWIGGYCRFLTGKHWIAHAARIVTSRDSVLVCDTGDVWNRNPAVYLGKGWGVIHHLNALDSPGEWFWQHDTLYYHLREGETKDGLRAEARCRQWGVNLRGRHHVVLQNLTFFLASVNIEEAEHCRMEGCNVLYPVPFFFYWTGWVRNRGGGKEQSIAHWEGKGLSLSGKGNVVRDCYVAHSWGDGISVGGINNRVENCLVEDCDWSATDAAVISVTGWGHTITGCTLREAARSVLVNRYAGKTDILHNDLSHAGRMCEDLGITYSYHTHGHGSRIARNRVHDNHAASTASGIYLDNYDTAYVVDHNIVWNVDIAIQTNKPAVGHRICNNTAWHCRKAMHAWGREGTTVEDQLVANNLSDQPWDVGTRFLTNITTHRPRFNDPEHGDFTLRPGSPAIDKGTPIPGITGEYAGKAPDAGACEYGLPPWKAGSSVVPPDELSIVKHIMKY